MQQCNNCGAKLPIYARFCGVCGQVLDASGDLLTEPGVASGTDITIVQSSRTYPASMNVEQAPQELNVPVSNIVPENELTEQTPLPKYQETDEHQALWPDMLLPWMVERQTPPLNLPSVQGMPQPGSVPTVEGSPATPNTPAAGQASLQHPAPLSATPPRSPSWNVQVRHGQQIRGSQPIPPQQHHQPTHSPHPPSSHLPHQPTRPKDHSEQLPGHHTRKPSHHLHSGKLHRQHLRNTTANLLTKTPLKWILLVVAAVVVLISSGVGLILARTPGPPALSLSGGSNVTPGSALHLHGQGFSVGGNAVLSLDHNLSFAFAGSSATKTSSNIGGAESAASLLMMNAHQLNQSNTVNNTVKVTNTGSFDVTIVVNESWPVGPHIIRATEGSQSAEIKFNVVAMPARLTASPFSLDFGKLEKGMKVVRSVLVTNAGAQRLIWTADTRGTPWLKLQSKAGAIELHDSQEFIYVTADTTHLQLGSYSSTVQIRSNGGNILIGTRLQVVPPPVPIKAKLNVNPSSLNFGQLLTGQMATLDIAVDNAGTQTLNWKVDTGNASWLMLNQSTGQVKPGGLPQVIQVTADATRLMPGNYTALLQISSNGGNASIQVTLIVTHSQPGQPPIPPSVLTATPYSFSTPADPNCSYNANSGWVCKASLGNYKNSGRDLNWTASSNGVSGATFIPSHGVLSPGQTTQVTITIPNMVCPSQGDLIFKGPGNITDILWNCGTSSWSFSPHNFKANTDCRYSANSGWTCIGTLAEASSSEGNLKWSASGLGLNGINLNPSGGILSPNQPVRVTVSVPNTRCPSSAIINFLASGEMPIAVPWLCGKPPVLIVNPTSLSASTDCNSRASGWQCNVMLEPAAGSQGNLSWFAFTGLDGVTFNPLSGTLSQGKRMTVTISIPNDDCFNDAFYFIGPGNIVKVQWKCTFVPPVIEVSPKSFAAYSANCPYDGYSNGWICTATLRQAAGSQNDLAWFTGTSLDGVFFNDANGNLSPNESRLVSIFVPGSACEGGTFTFTGPANAVTTGWNCTPRQKLEANLYSLTAGDANCPSSTDGWTCTVTIDETPGSQGTLSWFTDTGLQGVSFNDSSGILSPGQSKLERIFIPSEDCLSSSSGTFTFVGPQNPVNVAWNCNVPPRLLVSPLSFNVNKDCDGSQIGFWTCKIMLSSEQHAQSNLSWSVSASSSSVIYSNMTNGTLTPGQSVPMTIYVPSATCANGASGSLTFAGPANTVTTGWSCAPPPKLTISQDTFTADANCPAGNGGWTCTTTLAPAPDAQADLNWTASSGFSGVSFNQQSGTLSPGQQTSVSIFIPSSACQDGTFTFTGPANTVTAQWNCTPKPTFTASLDSCSYTVNQGWSCVATLVSDTNNKSDLNWTASSSGLSGITLGSQSGTLSPGQTAQVTISIADTSCPANATFTFTGPANTIPLLWACSAPVLTADTGGNKICPSDNKGNYTCTISLALAQGSQGYLSWSSSSSLAGITFSPSVGVLHPNQPQSVTATIPGSDCPSGTFGFSGTGSNSVLVSWQCIVSSPTPTPSPTPSPTDTPTPTPTPTNTPSPTPSPTETPTPTPTPTNTPTPTPTPTDTPTPPPPTPTPTPTDTPTPPPPTPTPTPPPPTPTPTPTDTPTPTVTSQSTSVPTVQSQQASKLDFLISVQSHDRLNPKSKRLLLINSDP